MKTPPIGQLFNPSGTNYRKPILVNSVSCNSALFAAAITLLLPSARALAQCAPGPAPVSVSSGSCSDPAFSTRESAGAAPVVEVSGTGAYSGTSINLTATGSGYGVHATGGGTITITGTPLNGASISTYGTGGHGVFASGGGLITGSYASVYTEGTGAYGVGAVGTGSKLSLTNSNVSTAQDNAHGAYAAGGGSIELTNTGIATSGAGASAVLADAGGAIILNDLSTFSSGDNSPGAVASGTGSSLALNNTYVNIYGNGSAGLSATGGGNITVSGGAIATGDYYGSTIIANSPGMLAVGTGSNIQVSAGATSATYGANSPGIWADAGGRISFSGYGIFTYQPDSPGAIASGAGSTVALTSTIARTSGPSAAGISVTDAGTVTVTDTEITTGFRVTGSSPPVLQFPDTQIGLQANGADVLGAGSRIQAEGTRITTNGDGAIGVNVGQGATALLSGGTITTKGGTTAAAGGADAVRATDVGSTVTVTGTSIATANASAVGFHARTGGTIIATDAKVVTQGQNAFGAFAQDTTSTVILNRTSVSTTGLTGHGIASTNGGSINATDSAVAVSGSRSAAIYLTGNAPSAVSFTGGALSAADGAIVFAEGGTGTVSIRGGAAIAPAVVNGRLLLARATEDAAGTPSNLTLNIDSMPSLAGDIVVDPSTLAYNLGHSNWTGNLLLAGPGNTVGANLNASRWMGDVLADPGNTADVALAQGSLWTGRARNATNVAIDSSSAWSVTADSNATGTVANAGLIQFLSRAEAYSTLTVGNYAGNAASRIGFNTYLGADSSPTNLLVIDGGRATGTTSVYINNTGGPGAQTIADGIRLVRVNGGATTTPSAFTLGQRVAAGAYEYELFRGGSEDPNDWYLRSHLSSATDDGTPVTPDIPLYRPEAVLYSPIPALARQMGLSTLATLHERVGDEEDLRGLPEQRAYANGAWGRVFAERVRSRWKGTADASATGNLAGFQTGFDIFRRTKESGHRDHVGMYLAYANYNSPSVQGFALGTQNLAVGHLLLNGPSVGGYWTHFGPSGWYLDAVVQGSWYDVTATSRYGAGISTDATGYAASLESGYPMRFGAGGNWLVEPQVQIVYQGVSVGRSRDGYSSVDWDAGTAWTARLGTRLQYTERDQQGRLWQPYARINLWRALPGSDGVSFGQQSPVIESQFGDTALDIGGGVTARINQTFSFYGQARYRWSIGGARGRLNAIAGTLGIRANW